jgi:GNAT superfamily N-acetyltransferase
MCDQWMPLVRLPLTMEQFQQLPRNPAYKYEYYDGEAVLSPRPRFFHARLDLEAFAARPPVEPVENVRLRTVQAEDYADLAELFAAAFSDLQPYGSLDEATQLRAAQTALERTRTGGDGPCIEPASFLVESEHFTGAVGAILVTLLPEGDPSDFDTYHWHQPPPPACIERRLGQPHLTWIFVAPLLAQGGVGTTLLAAAALALRGMGFAHLLSTFLLGNERSMLWHWRAGFELLAHPGSFRHMRVHWLKEMR